MPFCKKCGEEVPADAEFCPECGARIERTRRVEAATQRGKKSGTLTAGGALLIVAAFFILLIGIPLLAQAIAGTVPESVFGIRYTGGQGYMFAASIMHFVAFGCGVAGGVLALRRRLLSLVVVCSVVMLILGPIWIVNLVFSMPLAIVGLILVVARKREFS